MGRQAAISVLGLCLLNAGCSLIEHGARTLIVEPLHYCTKGDEYAECIRNRLLANNIWYEMAESCPGQYYSKDYEFGFKDGFVDYMTAGGNGEPPAVPHRRYWKIHHQNARGYQAMQDWLAGFSHGTTVAREGYYYWTLVPVGSSHWEVPGSDKDAPGDKPIEPESKAAMTADDEAISDVQNTAAPEAPMGNLPTTQGSSTPPMDPPAEPFASEGGM